MMKYLITGAAGQLGREMSVRIRSRGETVFPFSHSDLDITDLRAVRQCFGEYKPDVVINCASYNAVDKAEKDWKTAYMVNGVGPKNIAIAASEAEIPVVHFSTHFVFDGRKRTPYTIADAPNPLSRYGESKLLGEGEVRSLAGSFLLIRTSWLFGDDGNPAVSFPAKLMEWMNEKKELSIVDDQVSSPTYVPDLVSVTLALLKMKAWGLYHFNNNSWCSKYGWAEYIGGKTGWKGKIHPASTGDFPGGAARPLYSVLDTFPLEEICDGIDFPSWKNAVDRFLQKKFRMAQRRNA